MRAGKHTGFFWGTAQQIVDLHSRLANRLQPAPRIFLQTPAEQSPPLAVTVAGWQRKNFTVPVGVG